MGDITEMMLEGILCQSCGDHLDDSDGDFPQSCADCKKEEKEFEQKRKHTNKRRRKKKNEY